MTEFSKHEAAVLNYVQRSVPLVERPFAAIGSELGISEGDVQGIISDLKKRNVIRNIAGIFNGGSLGYVLNLVAMEIPEHRIEEAGTLISSHPGVSHNYLRGHHYNIWFTLAEESEELFKTTLDVIAKITGAGGYLILRNEKLLKIGVVLPIGDDNNGSGDGAVKRSYHQAEHRSFTGEEKEAVGLFQKDLPIIDRPFRVLVESDDSSLSEGRFLELGKSFENENIMRRYSAVLRHVNAGFGYNAMTAWKIGDDDNIEKKAQAFIDETAVSHLYLRKTFPGRWEYPLFAMIHAKTESEMNDIIYSLATNSGLNNYLVLQTVREFKKKRVVYFSHKFKEWRNRYYD